MAKKIAMLFPYTPSYREAIYKLMDKELDVDWFFCGNASVILRCLTTLCLSIVTCQWKRRRWGPVVYYKGIKKLNLQQYDAIICPGVIRSFSEWWLCKNWARV